MIDVYIYSYFNKIGSKSKAKTISPFASQNNCYDDRWIDKQERGLVLIAVEHKINPLTIAYSGIRLISLCDSHYFI